MKYFVTLGERTLEVVVEGDEVAVDGVPLDVRIERSPGSPEVRAIIEGMATTIGIESAQGTTWRLVDRGTVRDVVVEDERARHIRLLSGAGRAVDGHAVLKAPMPGLVLRLLVAVGDQVAAGMPLLALEAMKMENELKAAGPGVVAAVLVTAGQAVEKGQPLLEIGPASPA